MNESLSKLCIETDKILWNAWAKSTDTTGATSTEKLLFPRYRETNLLRVSEQEARLAFIKALCSSPFLYAVEAPTLKTYQFTGKKKLSAQTDLAIYQSSGERVWNVEFKSKGFKNPKKDTKVKKDIQKLFREPIPGLWFHLLKSVKQNSIENLISVLNQNIQTVLSKPYKDIDSSSLNIHICVLEHGFSLHTKINPKAFNAVSNPIKSVKMKVSQDKSVSFQDISGWEPNKRDT